MSGVDVVAVWDREIDAFRKTEVMIAISVPERRQAYADQLASLTAARATIAELIAADREFDAANDAYSSAKTGKPRNDAWDRVLAARERRQAALANVGSAP